MSPFYTHWKRQKNDSFLMFSERTKGKNVAKNGLLFLTELHLETC